jgi:hypothetical protein
MKPWKVQKFFGDVVYDLRSRGLLPVLILLVVALIAVPILISRGSSDSSPSLQPTASATKPAPEAETAVVSYAPSGLRNYKGRLDDLSAKDPFRQPARSAQSAADASQLSSPGAAATTASGGSSGVASAGSTSTSTGTGTGTTTVTHRLYLYHAVADISVGQVSQPLVRHKHIKAFSALPNQVTPVIIYLGSSLDEKRAYFSISKNANLVPGPGTCVPSPTDCSLLALEPGKSADMVYSVDGKTYRVKVNKIDLKRTSAG